MKELAKRWLSYAEADRIASEHSKEPRMWKR